jgi:predicted permease
VLAFTIAVATITGICCGLAPAVRATRVSPQSAMQAGARSVVDGRSRFSLGKMLVVAQIALSLVLVMSAGLLLGTLRRLVTLDPGFTREGVLMVTAELRNAGWAKERMQLGASGLLERLRTIPGVSAASASMIAPISGSGWNGPSEVDGFVPASRRDALVYFNAVSDAFFETMQTRIVAGRDFDRGDVPGAPRVAIVNQTVAKKFFGGENPVGKRMRVQTVDTSFVAVDIVGLVEDAKYATLRETPRATVYLPTRQTEPISTAITYELRVVGSPVTYRPLVTASIGQENGQNALRFTTLDDLVNASLARERLLGTLSAFFGGLALLLAVLGLYGTISYSVVRRRNEIGVRMTLGAARANVVRMVLAEVSRVTAIGIVLGAVGALAATRLLSSFLFGITPRDPATLTISALLLLVVAIAAGALPAWRAARLDPMVALREQ